MNLDEILELTQNNVIRWKKLPRLGPIVHDSGFGVVAVQLSSKEQDTDHYEAKYKNCNLKLSVYFGGAHWVSIGEYKLRLDSGSKVKEYRYNYHCEEYEGGLDLEFGDKRLQDLHNLIKNQLGLNS